MIERFIRWQIRVFLRGFHLHRDPSPHKLTAVVNFPKEGTDTPRTFTDIVGTSKEGVNA